MAIPEVSVKELKEIRDSESECFLLDVRSQDEYDFANINADRLVPMDQLEDQLDDLLAHKDERIVVMCRSGARSAQACEYLKSNGFTNVSNLKGGIREWSMEIDPSVPMY